MKCPELELYDLISFLVIVINLLNYDEFGLKKLLINDFEID